MYHTFLESRITTFEDLDFLELGDEDQFSGGSTGLTGPTGGQGITGATGPSGVGIPNKKTYITLCSRTNAVAGSFMQISGQNSNEDESQFILGEYGNFLSISLNHTAIPALPWTYRLRINGVNTALTVTSSTVGYATATATVGFSPGDLFSIEMTALPSPGVIAQITLELETFA